MEDVRARLRAAEEQRPAVEVDPEDVIDQLTTALTAALASSAYWRRKALDAQTVIRDRDRYIALLEKKGP